MGAFTCAAPALAQLNFPGRGTPPAPLPSPPLLDRLLFEGPWGWVLAAALLVAGVVAIARSANAAPPRRGESASSLPRNLPRIAGVALLLGAIAVFAAQFLVQTPREQIHDATRKLVDDVAAGRIDAIDAALSDDAVAISFHTQDPLEKAEVMSAVRTYFGPGANVRASLDSLTSHATNERFGRAQFRVVARSDWTNQIPVNSWWQVQWRRDAEAWRVTEIRSLETQ
ncbi:MAG: hypothetical protein SFZ23_00095 [Planctomycetota bacterium]|nr:hypothetical protein [Planctomycetota bacterium]